jgi:crotonobetainyl-CoA:carnitine CoA-transferase CaiB-like acyl-CoA transferase
MRERTGRGQHIDISMIDATLATDDQLHFEMEGSEATRNLPPDIWETGAGAILVSVDFRHLWRLLSSEFGVTAPNPPDMDLEAKIAARRAAVEAFMRTLTSWQAVEATMAKMNLAWGRVRTGDSLREQPTIAARGSFADIDDRAGGVRSIAQSPYRFSDATSGVRGPAPHRGEHNVEVLETWLGASPDQIAELLTAGVLVRDETYTTG